MKERVVDQIYEITERGFRIVLVEFKIESLQSSWEEAKKKDVSISDFVIIRLVTILEVLIRQTVQRIVDHGDPYRTNGIKIIKKWSSDVLIDSMLAIKDNRITFGALVAHGISINTIESIISTLEAIFGDKLKTELASMTTRWTEDKERGVQCEVFIKDLGGTIENVKKLLAVRHILVHELPKEKPYSDDDILEFLSNAKQFAAALDWFLVSKLWDYVPRTQTAMNRDADRKLREAQAELDRIRSGTSDRYKNHENLIQAIEYHWDQFCDLSGQLEAEECKGGSIAPMLYAREKERLLRWRISEVNRAIEFQKQKP